MPPPPDNKIIIAGLTPKREVLVAKVTNGCRGQDTKAISNGRMKVGEGDQKVEKPSIQERDPSIDKVTFKIFVPPFTFRLENDVFITEKGVRDGKNICRDDQKEIMDARIE